MNHETVATVAQAIPGVISAHPMQDHVIVAANDAAIKAITKAVGIVNVEPVAFENLPQLAGVDWTYLRDKHGTAGSSPTYRIGQLDARQQKALAAAATGDFSDVA